VASFGTNVIVKIARDGTSSIFANSGLNGPDGLAFDSAGNLFVSNYLGNTVTKITPDGVSSLFASTGLNRPAAIAFDPGGDLYVMNRAASNIEKFTPAGVGSVAASGFATSVAFAIEPVPESPSSALLAVVLGAFASLRVRSRTRTERDTF
jgi:DNA-binding beta-propeller fold protein YncE